MPLISSYVSTSLDEQKKETLKTEFGKIITTIPGKTEKSLMLTFQDNISTYFRGDQTDCSYLEVKLFGSADKEYKAQLVEKLTACVASNCNIPSENIYITVSEIFDWSSNGQLLEKK
ncbi:phenylpyruvate tautomerase PptA (4-oxalocrotonate tautomerase family) [Natranaerovirga hydrolytica]|uniref:Phenylpyruvate tautomerase PptA (4-oxalocrotonate tautomerase family) n=1 Tax=Natranaerovirga hydrolytica TaxID=680378 RepID=A0A4R1MFJ7_9FIRM|nr:tautomerase family protein [Natranaerovirga hydrolytica]TCK90490.1 phenylpyruvate tautomerase PptA (4-oxalocrotonate tautomerase family) [Natranaerovirga hydrolytica]